MKTKVSGHSGLPEEVELRMMQEKAEAIKRKKEAMYSEILEVMKRYGVAPNERLRTIAAFVRWMEQEKGGK